MRAFGDVLKVAAAVYIFLLTKSTASRLRKLV
jgi:hypothetical protein